MLLRRRNLSICHCIILLATVFTLLLFAAFRYGNWADTEVRVSTNLVQKLTDAKLHAPKYFESRNVDVRHDNRNQRSPLVNSASVKHTTDDNQRQHNNILLESADSEKGIERRCKCDNVTANRLDKLAHDNKMLPSSKLPRHTGGYMLSFRYYEQQTQGIRNLLQMQCLAHSFGMKIVEPFIVRSQFAIPLSDTSDRENLTKKYLGLSDLVDMKLWNSETRVKFGYTDIATWEDFLLHAPRKVVAHCIRYRNPPKIEVPIPGFNYKHGCPGQCFTRFIRSMEYLDYAGGVMADDFMENVVGKYAPGEVTVMVNEFRGFFGLYRLPVLSECGITHGRVNISSLPSLRIRTDVQKYSKLVFQGRPYASVIARIERVILHLHQNVSKCSKQIATLLKDLRSSHGISDTFLAMDVGKFGSSGSARNNFQPYGEVLFKSIYGNQWLFDEWESSFASIASSDNPAYVANLQRTIAASSKCLILFGGGGFQGMARRLYERFHQDPRSWCIYNICSNEV